MKDLDSYFSIIKQTEEITNHKCKLQVLCNADELVKILSEPKNQLESQAQPINLPNLEDYVEEKQGEKSLETKKGEELKYTVIEKVVLVNIYYGKHVVMHFPGMFAQQVFMEIMKNPKKFGDFKVSRLDLLLQPSVNREMTNFSISRLIPSKFFYLEKLSKKCAFWV